MENIAFEQERFNIYTGVLHSSLRFAKGGVPGRIEYDFACPEYELLREKYALEEIAGEGSDFERAVRLMHHFAPQLVHKGDYDNHIACNALDLLKYSFGRPENGINCLNKAKILAECCLAVGIIARRVHIRPCSPYDFDSHVVTEIFEREMGKWIMIDCTEDGYFVDGSGTPLHCMQIRTALAMHKTCTIVYPGQEHMDPERLMQENIAMNAYFAKNLFYIGMDVWNGFGEKGGQIYCLPEGYDMKAGRLASIGFNLKFAEEYGVDPKAIEERIRRTEQREFPSTPTDGLWDAPMI